MMTCCDLLLPPKQCFEESLLSGLNGDVGAEMFFELIDIIWHDDLSLFAEDGQDAVKEIIWRQTNGHGGFSLGLVVVEL